MHEMATVEVSENLLLEVPHHFVDFMVFRQITNEQNKEGSQIGTARSDLSDSKAKESE